MENYKEGEKKKKRRGLRLIAGVRQVREGGDERRQTIFDERERQLRWGGVGGGVGSVKFSWSSGVGPARRRHEQRAEKGARRPGRTQSAVDGEEVEAASSALSGAAKRKLAGPDGKLRTLATARGAHNRYAVCTTVFGTSKRYGVPTAANAGPPVPECTLKLVIVDWEGSKQTCSHSE